MGSVEPTRIQFEEESPQGSGSPPHVSSSKFARWIVSHSGGLVRDEKHAQYGMIVLVVAAIAAALFLLRESGTYVERGGPGPDAEELETYRTIQPF